ncbi:MAG: PHB depolymerase family esterase [Deltaproteobacteria bacterium]|nr:PHB depolymerase family esterase [Deltaproteobacteria bacterium]
MIGLFLYALVQVSSFGSNPGGLNMYEYVPSGLPAGRPLVVVMHGCTQTAAAMTNAGWNQLADQYQFAVVYPEQTSAHNPVECFNWAGEYGNLADITRGQGENESIIQMVDYEVAHHGVDTTKVYVAGFSAGAAFTTVMLATWPDRFAAGAIMEGIAYKCAVDVNGAYSCQSPGVTKTAAAWGDLVRSAHSGYSGPWPRVQIWEGSSDTTVVPANQGELVKQWTNVWGIDQTADETETIGQATRTGYKSGNTVAVETYTIQGMSHAVSVGTDPLGACGGTAGSYFEDHKICASLRAARFFGLTGTLGTGSGGGSGSGEGGDPTVAIVSPSDGDEVSGAVTVVVAAGNATSVDLTVDGASIGSDSDAPYQFAWDATTPGSHMLVATAHGMTGDATAHATVMVADGGGGGGCDVGGGGGSASPARPGDLPACSLNAGRGGLGLAPILMAVVAVLRRRRR